MAITKQDFDLLQTVGRYKKENINWFIDTCGLLFKRLEIPIESQCYVFTRSSSGDKLSFDLNKKLIVHLKNPKKPIVAVNIKIIDIDRYRSSNAYLTEGDKFVYSDSKMVEFDLELLIANSDLNNLDEDILSAVRADLQIETKTVWRKHTSPLLTKAILDSSDLLDRFLSSNLKTTDFILKEVFNSDELIQKLKSETDFYLQKAKEIFSNLYRENLPPNLVEKVTKEYIKGSGMSFNEYVTNLEGNDKTYMLQVGELISYMDTHAAGKNIWNQYEDKRVVAKASVRQNRWVESVFSYFLSKGDLASISSASCRNAFEYIRDPRMASSILSDNHRKLLSKRLFNQPYTNSEDFVNYMWELSSRLELEMVNDQNYTYAFGMAIYHPTFTQYWNPKENKMNYYIIGSKYGENNDEDIYPQMRDGNFICVGFNVNIDLAQYFSLPEKKSDKAIKALELEQNATNCLRKFVNIMPGDLIAVKASGSPKGKNAYLSIIGIAKVIDTPKYYNHDPNGLGHLIAVEWLEKDILREYGLGYGATLHRMDKKEHIEAIFNGSGHHDYNPIYSTKNTNIKHPLNQILYGPPGTGKTYATIGMAVEIANPKFANNDSEAIKQEFQRLVSEGIIGFTTFHQSLGYEEFIEGIKPRVLDDDSNVISYEVQPGIFQKMAINASFDMVKELETAKVQGIVGFSEKYDNLVSSLEEQLSSKSKVTIKSKSGGELIIVGISTQRNISLKHHDEGQPYIVSKNRMKKLNSAFPDLSVLKNIDKEFRQVIGGSNSSAYWAVLNAISELSDTSEDVSIISNEPFSFEAKNEIVQEADNSKFQSTPKQNYVLIIDEINRGNVSKIFGELITLLEESKRLGKPDYIKATLPYSSSGSDSRSTFGVPPNLYVIGTMNTADRSVEALDTALRRRFSFTEVMPDPSILDSNNKDYLNKFYGHSLSSMLYTINSRIEILLDRDHTIGHSYFMNLENESELINVFTDNIIPLLQEYFYNDYSKIEMVMGSGFIGCSRNNPSIRFAMTTNTPDIDIPEFNYHLKSIDKTNIQEAIDMMMNITKQ